MIKRSFGLVALLIAALTLTSCSLFYPVGKSNPTPTSTTTKTATPTPTPTSTQTANPNLKKVEMNIIDSSGFRDNGYVEVIAEAKGILEDDGQCLITVTQGSVVANATVKADQNVTSTQCFPLQVPITGFKNGKANFVVQYVSSKYSGTISGSVSIQ